MPVQQYDIAVARNGANRLQFFVVGAHTGQSAPNNGWTTPHPAWLSDPEPKPPVPCDWGAQG
jgi:hypothetical protein